VPPYVPNYGSEMTAWTFLYCRLGDDVIKDLWTTANTMHGESESRRLLKICVGNKVRVFVAKSA